MDAQELEERTLRTTRDGTRSMLVGADDRWVMAASTCLGCGLAMVQLDSLMWCHLHSGSIHCDPVMGQVDHDAVTQFVDVCDSCDHAGADHDDLDVDGVTYRNCQLCGCAVPA